MPIPSTKEVNVFEDSRNKLPESPQFERAISLLLKLGIAGGIGAYGVSNSLYNVEGGHRAIVFNR
ncbi:hypothetical protein RJ641_022144 [Dillenia turbinata]|uniref:Prohibitin n=1 Tax=Dillenia turbinata TaxID=194707 RepID=A0AAN8YWT6_9MAGN